MRAPAERYIAYISDAADRSVRASRETESVRGGGISAAPTHTYLVARNEAWERK